MAIPGGVEAPGDGFWAALLDEKGEVAGMTCIRSLAAAPGRTVILKKGDVLRMKGAIPATVSPGSYTLVAGFLSANASSEALLTRLLEEELSEAEAALEEDGKKDKKRDVQWVIPPKVLRQHEALRAGWIGDVVSGKKSVVVK